MSVVRLFVDTNLFIQCLDLDQIPWSKTFGVDEIDLIVGAVVQRELDRLKGDQNRRRSRRARKAIGMLRDAINSNDLTTVVRNRGPCVRIVLAPPIQKSETEPSRSHEVESDERLIAEAVYYARETSQAEVRVLSGDTGLILRAQSSQMPYTMIPDDWLLPIEPDERDQRIAKLAERVRLLEMVGPRAFVDITNLAGEHVAELNSTVTRFLPMDEITIRHLIEVVTSKHPIESDFGQGKGGTSGSSSLLDEALRSQSHVLRLLGQWEPPSEEAVKQYQQAYEEWVAYVRRYFERMDTNLNARNTVAEIRIVLRNEGSRPANGVIVELIPSSGLDIQNIENVDNSRFEGPPKPPGLRAPPSAPKGRSRFDIFRGPLLPLSERIANPLVALHDFPSFVHGSGDKNEFYWEDDDARTIGSRRTVTCEEFRHGLEPKDLVVRIVVQPGMWVHSGSVRVRLSATNVAIPIEYVLPVRIEYVDSVTSEIGRNWWIETTTSSED